MSNTMKTGVLQAGHAPPELTPGFGDYDQFFERQHFVGFVFTHSLEVEFGMAKAFPLFDQRSIDSFDDRPKPADDVPDGVGF